MTEIGLNWIAFCIHNAPGLSLAVLPSLDDCRRNSSTRIDPLIADCPALRERVVEPKSRESGNSIFRKKFDGGELLLTGATSAKGLRSIPARYLFLDEVDGYPADADGEGDPVTLAMQRTVTFRGRRKIYLCSTPTVRGTSRIEAAYGESDQRVFEVPCKHCGTFAPIVWADIHWPEGQRDRAFWSCPSCGGCHEDFEKPALLAGGRWRATAPGDGRTAGFHLSGLYSPFETWGDIALEHGNVYRDPSRLKAWTNLKLGETWEDSETLTDAGALAARREDWGTTLPAGVLVLTAGIDVQGNRLELTIIGWGLADECWIIAHETIFGDPTTLMPWVELDQYLNRTWSHSQGGPALPIQAACIDTGGSATQAVYDWARDKHRRRIWAIKGDSQLAKPLWPRRPSKNTKGRITLYILNVDAGKEAIYGRLGIETPGPGYIHLNSDLDDGYIRGLTSERVRTRLIKGRPVRTWFTPVGVRNEPLDGLVYGMAALHGLKALGFDPGKAAQLAIPLVAAPPTPAAPPVRRQISRSSWLS